jgi:anti-sigma regulatory factor (Ser/Thr protein kinase)
MIADPSQYHVQMRIISQPQYLCVIRSVINVIGGKCGLSSTETDHVVLAVDEAVTNVIRHGYKDATDQFVDIGICPLNDEAGQGIEIVINDLCENVQIEQIQKRDLSELSPGGLGIHILYRIMDHVHYGQRQDKPGICLTMKKYHKESKDN